MKKLASVLALCLVVVACGSGRSPSGPSPTPSPSPSPNPTPTPTPTPTPGPIPAGAIFYDTFTEANQRLLLEHTPDRGMRWNLNEDTSGGTGRMIIAGGMDWLTPGFADSARISYYASPQTALVGADYYVQATLDNQASGSADDFAWLMLRRTDPGTFYGAGWYAAAIANDCYIFRVVSGVYTQLANGDCNFTGTNTANASVIRLAVQGDTLTLFKDGNSILSAAGGNAISAPGAGGVGAGNIRNPTDDISGALALDDFLIVELR